MSDSSSEMKLERSVSSQAELEECADLMLPAARRRILLFDRSLSPAWNRPARIDSLRAFCLASPRNEFRIALHDASTLRRDCPRLAVLMETFAHVISVRETRPEARHAQDPLTIVDDRHFLHRFHVDSPRAAFALNAPAETKPLTERFLEIWAASDPASPATTLGL